MRANRQELLYNEPMRTVIYCLQKMADRVLNETGRHGVTRLSLTPDVGLMLGIMPGTSVDVQTCAGPVEVYCEGSPRWNGVATVGRGYCLCPGFRPRGTQTFEPPSFWSALTDEQRLSFLEAHPCCRSCGSLDTGCHCNNDE